MRNIEEFKYTGNRAVYNRALKLYRDSQGDINCGYCRYHKVENIKSNSYYKNRTWKRHRKTQYKMVEIS